MHRTVNLFFIILGVFATLLNTPFLLRAADWQLSGLWNATFLYPLVGTIYFAALHFLRRDLLLKLSQVTFLFTAGALSTLEQYSSVFGLGFCLLSVYLAHKYDFLRKRFLLKVGIVTIFMGILVVISERLGNNPLGSSVLTLAFILFFYAIFFLGESDWVRKLEANIRALKESKERLDHTLEEVEGHRNDLVQIGFTKKEIEVGRALVQTKTIDKQIAYDLGISMNTLRNHFKSMRKKTGAETKQQLIDAIRWYYLGDNQGGKQE